MKVLNTTIKYGFIVMNLFSVTVQAVSFNDGRPVYIPKNNTFAGNVNPYLNAAPKSLAIQRLSPSSYPEEAEVNCDLGEQCTLGLSRNLVIGSDIAGMINTPMRQYFDPNAESGRFYLIDIFGGVQILKNVDGTNYMNAQIGYRRLAFNDGTEAISSQGITMRVNYSQLITPIYLQNIQFSGFLLLGGSHLNNENDLNRNAPNHNTLNNDASYFYRVSQGYPTLRVSFPAELEVINWNSSQTNLPSVIHGYAHIEPFYIQNELSFSANNISITKTEQNFGIRLAALASYESTPTITAGRYALKTGLGIDIASSSVSSTSSGNADLSLPQRAPIAPYLDLEGSWQL